MFDSNDAYESCIHLLAEHWPKGNSSAAAAESMNQMRFPVIYYRITPIQRLLLHRQQRSEIPILGLSSNCVFKATIDTVPRRT